MANKDNIPLRLAKLNQIVDGKSVGDIPNKTLLCKDGLLDSLVALYEECERRIEEYQKHSPKHISSFVNRGKQLWFRNSREIFQ